MDRFDIGRSHSLSHSLSSCNPPMRVCAMHPFYFMGFLRVSSSHLYILSDILSAILFLFFILFIYFPLFLAFLPCFCFMLSLELCGCSSDLLLFSRSHTRLATVWIIGYG